MPTTVRLASPDATMEPVSLALAKQWLRVDGTEEDAVVEHLLKAAREKAENYTGLFFVGGQRLALTYSLSEAYALPEGATAESVSGFFADLDALAAWNWVEYVKGISVSRDLPLCAAGEQTYTVTVQLSDTVAVPEVAKSAILELAAEWYKNREASVNGTISVQTQVNWQRKLAELRVNPLGT